MRVSRLMLPRHKLTMHAYKRAYQRDNSDALCTVAGTIFHPAAPQDVCHLSNGEFRCNAMQAQHRITTGIAAFAIACSILGLDRIELILASVRILPYLQYRAHRTEAVGSVSCAICVENNAWSFPSLSGKARWYFLWRFCLYTTRQHGLIHSLAYCLSLTKAWDRGYPTGQSIELAQKPSLERLSDSTLVASFRVPANRIRTRESWDCIRRNVGQSVREQGAWWYTCMVAQLSAFLHVLVRPWVSVLFDTTSYLNVVANFNPLIHCQRYATNFILSASILSHPFLTQQLHMPCVSAMGYTHRRH